MARRFDIVFCDATDTLLRIRGSVGALYAEVAHRFGFAAEPAVIDVAFRTAMSAAPPPCFPDASSSDLSLLEKQWWHDVVAATFAPLGTFPRFEPFFAAVFDLFRTTAAWELLPHVRETLTALHAEGRRLGIISDMDARLLDVLEEYGIRQLFDPVVLSTRAGVSKRDGALFPYALQRAGVSAASAVHVGDSLVSDVQGARAAGMAAILLDGRASAPRGVVFAPDWAAVLDRVRELESHADLLDLP